MKIAAIVAILFLLSVSIPSIQTSGFGASVNYPLAYSLKVSIDPSSNSWLLTIFNLGTRPIGSYMFAVQENGVWQSSIVSGSGGAPGSIPVGGSAGFGMPCVLCDISTANYFFADVKTSPTNKGGFVEISTGSMVVPNNQTYDFSSYPRLQLEQYTNVYPKNWTVTIKNVGTMSAVAQSRIIWTWTPCSQSCQGVAYTVQKQLLSGHQFISNAKPITNPHPASIGTLAQVCTIAEYYMVNGSSQLSNCQEIPVK